MKSFLYLLLYHPLIYTFYILISHNYTYFHTKNYFQSIVPMAANICYSSIVNEIPMKYYNNNNY